MPGADEVRFVTNPHSRFVAYEDEGHFQAIYCSPGNDDPAWSLADASTRSHHVAAQGSLDDWVQEKLKATAVEYASTVPGRFYRRIWRPSFHGWDPAEQLRPSRQVFTQCVVAANLLIERLGRLFLTVEPVNEMAFGHGIREVLLLACMEVESCWAGVLREHGYSSANRHWNTTDYVKLRDPMHLSAYTVRLCSYPDVPAFKPFCGWSDDEGKSTQSLRWYDAYNKTKHNREKHFSLANLQNAIHAVGAAVVMVYAQFGPQPERWMPEPPSFNAEEFMEVGYVRSWPEACYVPRLDAAGNPLPWNGEAFHF